MEKKRGRPSTGRSEYLEVRLTPDEKQRFELAAQGTGLSLSDWVRFNLRAMSAHDPDKQGSSGPNIHGKNE